MSEDASELPGLEIIREPQLILEETAVCPVCGKRTLKLRFYLYEVSYFGKILLTTGMCSNCGYRYRDVRLAEALEPKKIIVRVEGERQLRYLMVKAASAAVFIPERSYEMIPGPASVGFITTVEGILHRFREVLDVGCSAEDADKELCERERRWLERAIDGLEKFTMVICDYEGGSAVKGEPGYVEELSLDKFCEERRPAWLSPISVEEVVGSGKEGEGGETG